MNQRYDLLAISLLIFAVVLVTSVTIDPKGFAIKEWQPLMAAIAALFGAGIVYKGASLSYVAALKKIDLDREIHQRDVRRRRRGIVERFWLSVFLLHGDLERVVALISSPLLGSKHLDLREFKLNSADDLNEAWLNLEAFSQPMAREISRLRIALRNYSRSTEVEEIIELVAHEAVPTPARRLKDHAAEAIVIARAILRNIEREGELSI